MPLIIRGLKEDVNISLPQLEGGDRFHAVSNGFWFYFNPHHREGGDNGQYGQIRSHIYFNPHHREGGDIFFSALLRSPSISIHTTAKVVTRSEA